MSTRLAMSARSHADLRAAVSRIATADEGRLEIATLPLHYGGRLAPATISWRLAGAAGAPVVAALGGISAHRRVFDADDPRRGWWCELVGPGLPLDTDRFRVLAIDWLGGSGGSTGPGRDQLDFPLLDARDQATALLAVCDSLAIESLHAIAGASYGGMVALALAAGHPERVGQVLAISAAHRTDPLATAWRAVQREIVRHAASLGDAAGGLRIARALAMTTYRTRTEFEARFATEPLVASRARFPVEEYLFARGDDYARKYRPESFLSLSTSIDLHRVDPAQIRVPVTLVSVAEDQLVAPAVMRELASTLAGPCELAEIRSPYGHDAFLKERALLEPAFAHALGGD